MMTDAPPDDETLRGIGRRLAEWYRTHRRDLPWRHDTTPYRVLVSEVMLQQTGVRTVIPYFERWMECFPDLESLAGATERQVLSLWEGLGYYQRARRLLAAARRIVEEFDGRVPRERADLLSLPGVGPYVAAAVRSFAFDAADIALDANVVRIFMRLLALEGTGSEAAVRRQVLRAAEVALPGERSAPFNQALMDFGALVCRPRSPRCGRCLLQDVCRAFARGVQFDIPRPSPRRLRKVRSAVAVFLGDHGRVYVQRRPPEGLFGGMWEFPGGKAQQGESEREALVRECAEELGVEARPGEKLAELTHYYTVFEVRLHAFLCPPPNGLPLDDAHRWVPVGELGEYPMPSANRQIVERLRERVE